MKLKSPKQQKCQNCGEVIKRSIDYSGREVEGWAIIQQKKVCQICFGRLKIKSKTRARPTASNTWKKWMELTNNYKKSNVV